MPSEDAAVILLLVVGIAVFGGGFVAGRYTAHAEPEKAPQTLGYESRFDALDERLNALAASRCMTVNTPVLNVSVYETPDLGKQKVRKP